MANESYEDFARALQTEYEEDCGVTFGKVPITAIAKLTRVVEGEPQPIGRQDAEAIKKSLVEQKMLDTEGRLLPAFNPKKPDFKIELPEPLKELVPAVVDLLASYQIERHIRQDKDEGVNRLKKEVLLNPEFQALWDRIKPKTTYRVEFETDELVRRAVTAIKKMEKIEAAKIRITAGQVGVVRGGVTIYNTSKIRLYRPRNEINHPNYSRHLALPTHYSACFFWLFFFGLFWFAPSASLAVGSACSLDQAS